jgi:hypothetical protein
MSEDGPLCSVVFSVGIKRDREIPDPGPISEGTTLMIDERCRLQLLTGPRNLLQT